MKDFGWALAQLKAGNRVAREGWGASLLLDGFKFYTVLKGGQNRVLWTLGIGDVLAEDWKPAS
jgi:hypothetical protein